MKNVIVVSRNPSNVTFTFQGMRLTQHREFRYSYIPSQPRIKEDRSIIGNSLARLVARLIKLKHVESVEINALEPDIVVTVNFKFPISIYWGELEGIIREIWRKTTIERV